MNKFVYYLLNRPYLETQWNKVHIALHLPQDTFAADEFERIMRFYLGKNRHYHGVAHLVYGLELIDELAHVYGIIGEDLAILKIAFFYHDIVYEMDNKAPWTNEYLSAEMAAEYLDTKVRRPIIDRVKTLIRETADHQNSKCTDPLWPLMNDADLAIIAAPAKVYRKYAENVWKEYSTKYTRAQFVAGRSAFLKAFKEKSIFLTRHMITKEDVAKVNIEHEIIRLWAETPPDVFTDASAS